MTHPFYCQMDYRTLPLTASFRPEKKEEIISCCCASSMLVEGMLDLCFPPEECFRFASECGLEDCTGELFPVFCGALAGRFSLRVTMEQDIGESLLRLKDRHAPWLLLPVSRDGAADGALPGRQNHIVLVNGVREDGFLMLDPMFRPGRSNRHVRRNRLRLDGDGAVVSREVLGREYTDAPFFSFARR